MLCTSLSNSVPSIIWPNCMDITMPIITHIVNLFFSYDFFLSLKFAYKTTFKNQFSISVVEKKLLLTLNFVFPFLLTGVLRQIFYFLSFCILISQFQATCRKYHSPETALLHVQKDTIISLEVVSFYYTYSRSFFFCLLHIWSTALNMLLSLLSDFSNC